MENLWIIFWYKTINKDRHHKMLTSENLFFWNKHLELLPMLIVIFRDGHLRMPTSEYSFIKTCVLRCPSLLIDDLLRQLPVGLLKWFSHADIFPRGRLTIYEGSCRMYMPLLIRDVFSIFSMRTGSKHRPTSQNPKN
jgi:hypothetical protein